MSASQNGAQLTYDPLGRLWQVSSTLGVTQFLYDGDELAAECDGAGNLKRRFMWGPDTDEPILEDHASGARQNRLGLPQALAHARDGDMLVTWKLDSLGTFARPHTSTTQQGVERHMHGSTGEEPLITSRRACRSACRWRTGASRWGACTTPTTRATTSRPRDYGTWGEMGSARLTTGRCF